MKSRREKGQAMVEYAVVLPIFLLVVMFLIEVGWVSYQKVIFDYTCRNAAWEIGNVNFEGYEGFTWPKWFKGAEDNVLKYGSLQELDVSSSNRVIKEYFSIANDKTTGDIDVDYVTVNNGSVSIYPGEKHYKNKAPKGSPEEDQRINDTAFKTTSIEVDAKIQYKLQTITPVNRLYEKVFDKPMVLTNNLYKVKRNRMRT